MEKRIIIDPENTKIAEEMEQIMESEKLEHEICKDHTWNLLYDRFYNPVLVCKECAEEKLDKQELEQIKWEKSLEKKKKRK